MSAAATVPRNLNSNPDTFVIAGPTGVGKTVFAAEFAMRVGGEIVCADAFQVYRGMGVLTAQPGPEITNRVPHHLYGCVDPACAFDAARYARMLGPVFEGIRARNRIPLLVGGSGLYLRAAFGGLDLLPDPDPELRQQIGVLSLPEALAELGNRDPDALAAIDQKNPRRVRRALEIVMQTGRPLAESRRLPHQAFGEPRGIVLVRSREELHERIAYNAAALFDRGVVAEVSALGDLGPTASRAIGLEEVRAVGAGRLSREAAIERIALETRRYAKRQLTWFRNQTSLPVVMLSETRPPGDADSVANEAMADAMKALQAD